MPYIEKDRRLWLTGEGCELPTNCGELNFVITTLLHDYLKEVGLKYKTINEVIGVLECAKIEIYRMIAAPYEDKKRVENGPISELDSRGLEDAR